MKAERVFLIMSSDAAAYVEAALRSRIDAIGDVENTMGSPVADERAALAQVTDQLKAPQ